MGRRGTEVAAVLSAVMLAAVLLLVSAPNASANACGEVKVKHHRLTVGGAGVGCGFQRRWTKRFLRRDREPSGWNCHLSSAYSGGCDKRRSKAFFVFYPPD
jgi:hypothetical protein